MIRLAVLNASTSPNRTGDPVADWVVALAREDGAFDLDVIDLRGLGLPLFDEPELPRYRRYVHDHTKAWSARVAAADTFVVVLPEYNRGYPAVLKNALDYLAQEWAFKPVVVVSYGTGISGGIRAGDQLREVLAGMQMQVVREGVIVPQVEERVRDGHFEPTAGMVDGLHRALDALVRLDAAAHLLRLPVEDVGRHQGDDGMAPLPAGAGDARDDRERWRRSAASAESFRAAISDA